MLPDNSTAEIRAIENIFRQRLIERGGIAVTHTKDAALSIQFKIDSTIGKDGFSIQDEDGVIVICGDNIRGLLYGVGKLLRTAEYTAGGFTIGEMAGYKCSV